MKALFQTDDAWSSLLLRITLGCVMFPHGAQKLLGWYGGGGFSGTMGFFTEQMGMPALIAFLIIIGESFGLPAGLAYHLVHCLVVVLCMALLVKYAWPRGISVRPDEDIDEVETAR